MKTTEITNIDIDDRVLSIGQYNAIVVFCPFCYPDFVELGTRTVVGYGTDIYGYVVEVHECPKCFEKSHHHLGDFHSYDMYKMFKNKFR
jgi:acetyltransferase-like isoleucine patch superfamily enzyme